MKTRLLFLKNRFLLLFIIYFFLRLLFLSFNYHQYGKFSASELALTFLYGLRFDISALFLLNLPIILWSLLPGRWVKDSIFNFVNHWLFVGLNIPFIFANLCDFEYYKFTGSRLTFDILLMRSEATAQLDQFFVNFWHIGALFLLITYTLHWFSKRWQRVDAISIGVLKGAIFGLVLMSLTLLGIRGGIQKKVLQPTHAHMMGHTELGMLTLNSTFTLLKSDLHPELRKVEYFSSRDAAIELIPKPKISKNPLSNEIKNVVIIILESYATEFWGVANDYPGYTPFLDSLAQKSLFFKNNFANGRRSIEALPSILLGVPSLMNTPIVKSNYQQNQWLGLGKALRDAGYHTSFFHGAPKGTMYFDAISAQAGLEDYYPLERYPHPDRDFDGNWGIYDEPLLQYMVGELSTHSEPFFSVAFTISTHQPYHVPPIYKGRFPSGPLEVHESVGYVDYALQKFFESAEKTAWFKNTLFILTGDHTQMSASEFYNTSLGGFMVPLLLYHPTKKWDSSIDTNKVSQHTDILPTVLDYLGIETNPLLLFGRSVLDSTNAGEAVLHLDGNYWLVQNDHFLKYNPTTEESFLFDYPNDLEEKKPISHLNSIKERMLKTTQAYIQYYRNGLIENNLYWSKASN